MKDIVENIRILLGSLESAVAQAGEIAARDSDALRTGVSKARQRCGELLDELNGANARATAADQRIQELEAELAKVRNKAEEADAAARTIAGLNEQIRVVQEDRLAAVNKVATIKREASQAKRQLADQQSRNAEIATKLRAVEQNNAEMKEQVFQRKRFMDTLQDITRMEDGEEMKERAGAILTVFDPDRPH